MATPAFFQLAPRIGAAAAVAGLLGLVGCQALDDRYSDSVPPAEGSQVIRGLIQNASIRRNNLGMPLIETNTFYDSLFSLGYVHASDRLSQMISMRLLAQGRLSELAGPGALDIDRTMRTVNLKKRADTLYAQSSPRLKGFFEVYARGVNAYLFRYRGKLPIDLAAADYQPEYWQPQDSALIFCLLNFNLSANLQEELASLTLAQKVGADRLGWLMPTYPDEPLPFAEAEKLRGLDFGKNVAGLSELNNAVGQVASLNLLGVAASNEWAIAPQRSRAGKSILANDTHLPAGIPSAWNFVQLRSPKYQAAGFTMAGLPTIFAGFNGKVAWGMAMAMGDSQDLFIEKVRHQGNQLWYSASGKWLRANERPETYVIKGQSPIRETVYETRHGALLNSSFGQQKTSPLADGYGLALQMPDLKGDQSLDAFFNLSRAKTIDQASDATREIRTMALNMVFADAGHVGWQVTGTYPSRREGVGMLPSPGWDGRYDWDGYANPILHPYDQDPPQGWLGNANQRTVTKGYGMQLSNSWYYPERAERIAEMAGAGKQDTRSTIAMQYDQTSLFAAKLKAMFQAPTLRQPLQQAIDALPTADRDKARTALNRLLAFDGKLTATSADAALYELFLQESMKQIFLDELGPVDSPAWKAFVQSADLSYSAPADHLLGRDDSPFWDDIRTPQKEDKPTILARSLVAAMNAGDSQLGTDRSAWQWGKLHHYQWSSPASELAPFLSASQRASITGAQNRLDRGPYPAGGDHTTLNAAAYHWGQDSDAWLIPAMRMIVDFSQDEPLLGMNGTGQSGNPASPHYADGIDAWLKGQYMTIPFQQKNLERAYGSKRLILVPGK